MALLDVQNVHRAFGGVVAVNRASFQVEPGKIKSIIGPNGAGKTTLFNIISGVLASESGRILFKGKNIRGRRPYRIAEAGISRTFQNPSLFLQMSVLENVMVGRHARSRCGFASCCLSWPWQRREERAIREAALAEMAFVGVEAEGHAPAGSLAFGRRRMIELARALATEPELLLLDEPASGLNTRETDDLGELIRRIRDRGITVLLVEHDMALVMDISDEILVLHNGAVLAEGAPAEVQNDPRVISVYLGEDFQHAAAG
ncbi:MAG TPA: ABC transporter ATP-binding protein [Candidatus Hydrogenedentes bacterium]|mgnify:CR=1 FL=1|nr:ABC transporter ATP-binding protein [Candidatus Hydrogenedentota bacterium]HPG68564.1 ABC transporter ATP-binding protein [Candidatus Hydrogenedentota bacterium]